MRCSMRFDDRNFEVFGIGVTGCVTLRHYNAAGLSNFLPTLQGFWKKLFLSEKIVEPLEGFK